MFGLTPLIRYSNHLGRGGLDDYVGIPLLVIVLLLAVFAWSNRVNRLLAIGLVFVLALGAGPVLVINGHDIHRLPWAELWRLPIARSAEPSRFIVFVFLVVALALALWLAAPAKNKLLLAARWGLGLLAVVAIITDTPTSYQAVSPLPQNYRPPPAIRAVNQLPAFITQGLYRQYLRPGEIVVILTQRGNAGMLFQADANFYFRIAGGYINASLTPVDALPHPVTLVAHPSRVADQMFADYLRSAGVGAILVEQAWEDPWMHNLGTKLGMHGTSVGGVTVYPVAPWLASQSLLTVRLPSRSPVSSGSLASSGCSVAAACWRTAGCPRRTSWWSCPTAGFTFSDTNAIAPVGMGSQKLTIRQPRTPSVATLLVTPKPTSSSGAIESTTPRPPGVSGSAPATLAMP